VTQFAFGHVLRIKPKDTVDFRFQNFFIGKQLTHNGDSYQFVPFGFSGVTVNRTGDGLEATLVFPNNELSRNWGVDAIVNKFVMEVEVLIIEDTDLTSGPAATHTIVHTYTGQVIGGQWDNVSLNLELGSILDAVGTDVPRRSLTEKIVGNLPITNSVRLQ
tara:strand:- start:239 stop:721 length:483 start_codon:yes stop_codon:yes gene_type:complete